MDERLFLDFVTSRLPAYTQVRRAILFGSRARRDGNTESDIDLCLVVADSADTRSLYIQLMREIASADWSLDLMVLTETEFDKKNKEGWSILKAISREGRVVYAA